jgi:hypothetical protein
MSRHCAPFLCESTVPMYYLPARNCLIMTKKTWALLVTLISTVISARAGVEAGPILNPANGHYYYLLTSDTWSNSEAQAVILGGPLVTINDAAEKQWVVNTFANYGEIPNRPLWIGLTDIDAEGIFQWISGQPVTYTNWNVLTGEPNNSGGSGYEEDFAYIVEPDSGNPTLLGTFWNDVPDDGAGVAGPLYGVVEVEPPTPVVHGRFVCWDTLPGVKYQAQWKPARSHGPWHNFGPVVTGTGEEVCVTDNPHPRPQFEYQVIFVEECERSRLPRGIFHRR